MRFVLPVWRQYEELSRSKLQKEIFGLVCVRFQIFTALKMRTVVSWSWRLALGYRLLRWLWRLMPVIVKKWDCFDLEARIWRLKHQATSFSDLPQSIWVSGQSFLGSFQIISDIVTVPLSSPCLHGVMVDTFWLNIRTAVESWHFLWWTRPACEIGRFHGIEASHVVVCFDCV